MVLAPSVQNILTTETCQHHGPQPRMQVIYTLIMVCALARRPYGCRLSYTAAAKGVASFLLEVMVAAAPLMCWHQLLCALLSVICVQA